MNYLLLVNLHISLYNLVHEVQNLFFPHFVLYSFVQIAATKLRDYVCVVFSGIDLMKSQDIRDFLELFEDLNLGFQKGPIDFVLEHLHINDFDCHRLL